MYPSRPCQVPHCNTHRESQFCTQAPASCRPSMSSCILERPLCTSKCSPSGVLLAVSGWRSSSTPARSPARAPERRALYEERFSLEPGQTAPQSRRRRRERAVIGTLLMLDGCASEVPTLEERPGTYAGATMLPNGVGTLVRVLGSRAEDVATFLESVLAHEQQPAGMTPPNDPEVQVLTDLNASAPIGHRPVR